MQFLGERRRVHRTSAAKRDQREFARVVTALYRHDAQGFGHAGVDDFDDPRGRFINGEPERIGDPMYRRFRRGGVDPQRASEQGFGIEITEHNIGVADGRLRAATTISGRSRIGAGALWADFQRPTLIDPGNTASAGTDFSEIDDRHPDGVPCPMRPALRMPRAADLIFGGDGNLAVRNQARFGRRPAHVEGNQVCYSELLAG